MKMYGIFLDDERNPEDVYWIDYQHNIQWFVVNRAVDFMFAVSNLEESVSEYCFSFDHDIQSYTLAGNEVTGYDCLKYLVDYCLNSGYRMPGKVWFHTQNPIGWKNMRSYYLNAVEHQNCSYTN